MSSSPALASPAASSPRDARPGIAATAALFARLLRAEWMHHPWRQAAAVVAVGLGVALAFAVQLINASALAEFDAAVHAASGAPDFSVRARDGTLPEELYPRVVQAPGVAVASPVVEVSLAVQGADGRPHPAQLLGLDALAAPRISPDWLPMPDAPAPRARAGPAPGAETRASGPPPSAQPAADAAGPPLVALDPDVVFVNAAARALIGDARTITLQAGGRSRRAVIAGRIAAGGPPLLVMDIAGAQTLFGHLGALSRIDVRLRPGARADDAMAALGAGPDVRAAAPDEEALRAARLSRSYRVNLSVLSLVALFTGGFLVFSVQSLAVAKRVPQLALLGVLGMDGRRRRALVLADSVLVGLLGAALGLALGTGLAVAALRALGGDLGSGTFAGEAPRLEWSTLAAVAYALLGLASALAGGWWPARAAQRIAPAQSLKGLSGAAESPWPATAGLGLIALAVALAFIPPWNAIPWGAYACVGVLLLGGISLVPQAVALLLRGLRGVRQPVAALAVARAIDQRQTATAAVAGVVASLSLVVALTVMVTSFRDSLVAWLDDVLPADLYVRPAGSGAGGPPALLDEAVVARARDALAEDTGGRTAPTHTAASPPVGAIAAATPPSMPTSRSASASVSAPASAPSPSPSPPSAFTSTSTSESASASASAFASAPAFAPPSASASTRLPGSAAPASIPLAPSMSPAAQAAASHYPAAPAASHPVNATLAPGSLTRVRAERLVPILLAPDQPEAILIARDAPGPGLPPDAPWIEPPRAAPGVGVPAPDVDVRPPGSAPAPRADAAAAPEVQADATPVPVYASEVLAALQHLRVGDTLALPLPAATAGAATAPSSARPAVRAVVRGIWRDYARQQGALLMDRADWQRLTGDGRVSGLVVWLAPGTPAPRVAEALARAAPADAPIEIATSGQLRTTSLRIFDRSFAVTRWLQGVALAIGLAGIAASFSAQVLARRREFGTLQHLGFTRRQVLSLVAIEGALWSAVGAVLGLVLGLAVSVVLVKVVNPQSFHWTMQMSVPTVTLAGLWLAVVAAGALTAWASGHAAAGRDVVRAVKEDW